MAIAQDRQEVIRIGVIGARGVGAIAGGIETYCANFYRHLPPERFRATIFVSRGTGSEGEGAFDVQPVPCLHGYHTEKLTSSFAAVFFAWRRGIRVLHYHGTSACISLPLAWMLGMRSVVRHVGAEYKRAKWGWLARMVLLLSEYLIAAFADRIVCLNDDIVAHFRDVTGRTTGVCVVPNGVLRPDRAVRTDVLGRLGLREGGFILAVGRLEPEKNLHLLIDAFKALDTPDWARLVIVGPVRASSAYACRLKEMAGDDGRIILPGALFGADLATLYGACRIFALPSSHEGMSFSLLEAAIAGANIVASDIPANGFVCRGFGHFHAVDSLPDLAAVLARQWARERSEQEIEAQIEYMISTHDWHHVAERVALIFEDLAKPRHGKSDRLRNSSAHS